MASLLPPNSTPLERALERVMARMMAMPVLLRDLVSPDNCSLPLLPYLAWALSIDSWSSDWPEAVKRSRVRRAMEIQRRKGTSESVRAVVESFGGAVALREWWPTEPRGAPHTFDLAITLSGDGGTETSPAFADAVIAEVRRTKPVRSHFTYTQGVNLARPLAIAGAVRPAIFARLRLEAPAA
ncbi:phage tail protein I [Sphingomonas sp. OTU376]|uniref:phage tail protein I n=1 Tax=Sphingomonas sp. OTU376 TaxID=3043863 RepID=UPI00313E599F